MAACDCQVEKAHKYVKELSGGKPWATYADFRQMIEREKLDAVMIETTTHARAWIAMLAMQMGMDAYIEKPMALTIAEGRAMVRAARKLQSRHAGRHAAAVDAHQQLGQRPGEKRRAGPDRERAGAKFHRSDPLDENLDQGHQEAGGRLVGRVDEPGRAAALTRRNCITAGAPGGTTTAAATASA